MTNRTRTQLYADQAHACVKAVSTGLALAKEEHKAQYKAQYKARADGFPVMIMQAGLAQSVGFMLAKAKEPAYQQYLIDVAKVLHAGGMCQEADGAAFHAQVIAAPLAEYRRLTRETLAAAGWLKRMGQALIGEKGEGAS